MTAYATIVRFQSKNYHEKLFEHFKLDDFTDVILWADGKLIRAHRCILAAGSTVLHEMLKLCDNVDRMPMLVLDGIKYKHLRQMLEYMYTGKTEIEPLELDEFFLAVKRFQILGLINNASIEESNTNNTTHDRSGTGVNCSMTYELASDNDEDGVENENNQTLNHGTKRKFDNNQNEPLHPSSLDETPRKSIPNVSKHTRTCTLPPEEVTNNRTTAAADTPGYIGQPSVQAVGTEAVAGLSTLISAAEKQAIPSNSKFASNSNGKSGSDGEVQGVNDKPADGSSNSSNEQFKCPKNGCGRTFETSKQLIRHKKYKCSPFKCHRCQQILPFKFALNKHQLLCSRGITNCTNENTIPAASRTKPTSM